MFFIFFLIFNCGYIEIRNKNLIRPTFNNQKTLILKEANVSFYPVFYIYKPEEIFFSNKENLLFKISKKISLFDYIFDVKDLKNNKSFTVTITKENLNFYIKENEKNILKIETLYREDYLNFKFLYNKKEYFLKGEQKGVNDIIHSIYYTISRENQNLGYIYKEFYYMKNSYEIIINDDFQDIEDNIFIILNLLIDTILKENGLLFRK